MPEIAQPPGLADDQREDARARAPSCSEFVEEVKADGFTDAVLLGMGGSSLGPEVIRRSFGEIPDGLRLHVLDSTDPGAVLAIERAVDLEQDAVRRLLEVGRDDRDALAHALLLRALAAATAAASSRSPTPAARWSTSPSERGFRRVFENDPDIGGRYSVLSYFGLVPAALAGVNIEALLHRAQVAEQNCAQLRRRRRRTRASGWASRMGELARQGRDKLTFVVSEPIESFGLWVEQLIAESTGKQGKGILPVAGEPLGDAGRLRRRPRLRLPARPRRRRTRTLDARGGGARRAPGTRRSRSPVHGAADLGRIFFFAEFATAVAGWVLGINPFDQPNVQEAKDNTAKVLEARRPARAWTRATSRSCSPGRGAAALRGDHGLRRRRRRSSTRRSPSCARAIRDRTKATTTFGYGPRFLHSTGQFHKGGPPTGLFLQLVHDGDEDVEIPEAGYGFRHLKNAQAIGDLQTLRDHGLPAVQIRLEGDPAG